MALREFDWVHAALDKLLWCFLTLLILAVVGVSSSAIKSFTWPETDGRVVAISYTCHSSKREGYGRRSRIFYDCWDHKAKADARAKGYNSAHFGKRTFSVEFVSYDGQNRIASISALEREVQGKKLNGVYRIRYYAADPSRADFSDRIGKDMRGLGWTAIVLAVLTFACRRFLRGAKPK